MSAEKSESYPAEPSRFKQKVLKLVAEIPKGYVATYGQVALLAGQPRAARQVGGVLYGLSARDAGDAETLPWHRVINARGGISTYKVGAGELQRALLEAEGVEFNAEGRCDLARYRFDFGLSGPT